MRCKLDENLPDRAADVLRAAGHDAMTVLDQGMGVLLSRIAELLSTEPVAGKLWIAAESGVRVREC